jgi:DMSO/TMAO reductase YedYZ molybdopterin-dependent catalytic subunit
MLCPMPDRRLRVVGAGAPDLDLPPGQHLTETFPTVTTGPPPDVRTDRWTLSITTADGGASRSWDWTAFRGLPHEQFTVDLHAARGWSKLATRWDGVRMTVLFDGLATDAGFAHVHTYGEYRTSLPLDDLLEMPTWIADGYEDRPLPAEHGGPARLLVPHLYFWKSVKWVRAIELSDADEPGTSERAGRHAYGDPWREQRNRDD